MHGVNIGSGKGFVDKRRRRRRGIRWLGRSCSRCIRWSYIIVGEALTSDKVAGAGEAIGVATDGVGKIGDGDIGAAVAATEEGNKGKGK